ncbi:MAG: aminotransferase class IV [Lentimicrobium sp.]|nr:aminotransferase class IV [Lentimicrobium sp.]
MKECSRDFFFLNNTVLPVEEFIRFFNPPAKYIYEVFRVSKGVALFIEDHLDRFFHTAALSGVDTGFDFHHMLGYIHDVISKNDPEDGNMKIVFYNLSENDSHLFIYFTPHLYPTQKQFSEGVDVELFFAERENPNAKVMNTSMRKSADEVKIQHQLYEVLLADQEGFVTEGSRSNLFFIRNNILITPPAETVLEGITRKQILNLCKINAMPFSEEKVHSSELGNYDAVFISGTSRRVLPVKRINEIQVPVSHPMIHKLQRLFEEMVNNYISRRV